MPRDKKFVVRASGVHGKGVFAARDLEKGERIIEYKGERITWEQALKRHPHNPLEPNHTFFFDIDEGMVRGCSHPMGPLRLADLIGLDTTMAVAESLYAEFKEPLYAPPPMLARMCEAGLLGRKTGRGFYDYS